MESHKPSPTEIHSPADNIASEDIADTTSEESSHQLETHDTRESLPTDSMITIRLSEPVSTPEVAVDDDPMNENMDSVSRDSVDLKRPTSLEIMQGKNLDTPIIEAPVAMEQNAAPIALSEDEAVVDDQDHERLSEPKTLHCRSDSTTSVQSESSTSVDWVKLDKTEEEESREETSDESTAFLLARLDQENDSLATDPRFGGLRRRYGTRPPSIHVLKKLVNDPTAAPTRYSLLPDPPPMTELEFWAALVKDYPQTAHRLPTLTTNKIRSGVPPPLRGVVWVSMCGARDRFLGEEYNRLCGESSPYENLIGKDIGRSFPGVEMFRDPEGDGQKMLGRVLKCFSLYDQKIGYCQGLGFLVGPLLMQMEDKDAFCVLVRLMENYDLRSCFLPDLSGLHLRIFQFQQLLTQHMPELAAHLASLQIEPAYLSKWFLSFFAITCPLPMLFRIYDVIFAEGASETMMRVALSLMKRNEQKIMASNEFEEVIQLLLGRALWEPYDHNADELVNDFMRYSPGGSTATDDLTGLVTRESLKMLENAFKDAQSSESGARSGVFPDVSTAASRFLGRLWTSTTLKPPPTTAPTTIPGASSRLQRTPSKMSIATINSTDVSSDGNHSTASTISTQITEATVLSRESTADLASIKSIKSKPESITVGSQTIISKENEDLYGQIEDLLTALTETQRDHALMATQLQREREERSEDHNAFRALTDRLRSESVVAKSTNQSDRRKTTIGQEQTPSLPAPIPVLSLCPNLSDVLEAVDDRLVAHEALRRSLILETKQRLRESLMRSKDQAQLEATRARELSRQVEEQEQELKSTKDELREARARLKESQGERQKLDSTLREMRSSKMYTESPVERPGVLRSETKESHRSSISSASGLRELRLGKSSASSSLNQSMQTPPRRTSSLATQAILSTEDQQPATADDLLVELVNAKTSEAMARQELDEVKAKLDAMRKMLGMPSPTATSGTSGHQAYPSESMVTGSAPPTTKTATVTPPATTSVASFWSWGKRSISSANVSDK